MPDQSTDALIAELEGLHRDCAALTVRLAGVVARLRSGATQRALPAADGLAYMARRDDQR